MKFNALLVSAAMMVMTLAACGDNDPVNPDNNQGGKMRRIRKRILPVLL